MVGELFQGAINEFRDENNASDPLSTVGRFVGTGINIAAMGEVLEVAGNIGGGLAMGAPQATPQPAPTMEPGVDPNVIPGMSGPSLNGP